MAKRGNGEGSIYKDNIKNRWVGQYTINTIQGIKRKSVYGATRVEVRDKLADILKEINKGNIIDDTRISLQDWIIVWIDDYKALSLKRSSVDNYRRYYEYHIKDTKIGKTPLKKITSTQIQRFINDKYKHGRVDGTGGLSSSSVKHIFNVIYGAMEQALKNNMVTQNPCHAVVLPKKEKREILFFNPTEANKFLDTIKQSKYYPLYSLELVTGLRLGEIIALRWENVDFDKSTISIKQTAAIVRKKDQSNSGVIHSEVILQTPKTKRSTRTLYIEEPIVNMLRKLRKEQLQRVMECGDQYNNSGFVFTNDYGNMVHPRSVQDHFKRAIKKAGLPNLHFHCLRHTAASIMLYNGVDIKTVQEILGHEDIQTTLDIYTHVLDEAKREGQRAIYKSITINEKCIYYI